MTRAWDDESLEEIGFVPSAVGELLRIKHIRDTKCNDRSFKFHELAAIVTQEGGAPDMINLGRNCLVKDEQGKTEVNGAQWKDWVTQKTSRGHLWAAFGVDVLLGKNVGALLHKKVWPRVTQQGADGS